MLIFSSKPGSVTRLPDLSAGAAISNAVPLGGNPDLGYAANGFIVQGYNLGLSTNSYMSPSIGRDVLLYVFPDQPGAFSLKVICPLVPCNGDRSGYGGLIDFYQLHKLSQREDPLQITIGPGTGNPKTFDVFLRSCSLDMSDPAFNIAQGSLSCIEIPDQPAASSSNSSSSS